MFEGCAVGNNVGEPVGAKVLPGTARLGAPEGFSVGFSSGLSAVGFFGVVVGIDVGEPVGLVVEGETLG